MLEKNMNYNNYSVVRHVKVLKENIQDRFEFSYDICYECKDYGKHTKVPRLCCIIKLY